jgi:hypothetical protein
MKRRPRLLHPHLLRLQLPRLHPHLLRLQLLRLYPRLPVR